jgi:hypothetical protein
MQRPTSAGDPEVDLALDTVNLNGVSRRPEWLNQPGGATGMPRLDFVQESPCQSQVRPW